MNKLKENMIRFGTKNLKEQITIIQKMPYIAKNDTGEEITFKGNAAIILNFLESKGWKINPIKAKYKSWYATAPDEIDLTIWLNPFVRGNENEKCLEAESMKVRYVDEEICFNNLREASKKLDQMLDPNYSSGNPD